MLAGQLDKLAVAADLQRPQSGETDSLRTIHDGTSRVTSARVCGVDMAILWRPPRLSPRKA
ncbi:hypothetical protein GCM10023263_55330 [Phytohabitans rumicis]